jgi:hypothetical protein
MAKKGKSRPSPTLLDTSRFRLVEPLALDDSIASSPELEEALSKEALLRGARELSVIERFERRRDRAIAPPPGQRHLSLGVERLAPLDRNLSPVWTWAGGLRDIARQELESLPKWVQKSFDFDSLTPRLDYYVGMRGVLYQLGYDDPAGDVFKHIVEGTLLDLPIKCGVHEVFRDRVAGLGKLLDSWAPGLASRTRSQIQSVSGFVPRFIAPKHGEEGGSLTLSNHALGLAVDIDVVGNPHIKEPSVIEAIREATGYDFGKAFYEESDEVPAVDRVMQIHMTAQKASDALQGWLQRWMPTYREMEYRRIASKRASFADDLVIDSEAGRAMELLKKINKYHSIADLEAWTRQGVQSIPQYLAAGMAALGFRWGNAYKSSKDGMHFELKPCTLRRCGPACREGRHILRPDSVRRPLNDLLQAIAP